MKTYTIEVRAIGYETLLYRVEADSKREAQRHEPEAINQWLQVNDLDQDSAGLAFVRIIDRQAFDNAAIKGIL